MQQRGFTGVFIPRGLWEDTALNWTEKCFLGEIDALDNGEGCYASNEYLADTFGTTKGNVAVMITKLRKLGYIEDLPIAKESSPHDRRLRVVRKQEPVKEVAADPGTPPPSPKVDPLKIAEGIYNVYPRKVGKPNALKKIVAAMKLVGFDKLLQLTIAFAEPWEGATSADLEFCPHPATWFNQQRYNDAPETWAKPRGRMSLADAKKAAEPDHKGTGWDKGKFDDGSNKSDTP